MYQKHKKLAVLKCNIINYNSDIFPCYKSLKTADMNVLVKYRLVLNIFLSCTDITKTFYKHPLKTKQC